MLRSLFFTVAAASLAAGSACAQNVPTGFVVDTLVSSGIQAGNDFTFLPDGRVLIASRAGAVHVWADGVGLQQIGTVSSVQTGSERGLLSIEADPDFATNGYVYVWWSSASDSYMHLDRFTCTGALSSPASTNLSFSTASRRVIIATSPDFAFNHNGGTARFGPDGMLYVAIGDDANPCSAQNLNSKSGCLLRLDVGALPAGPSGTEPSYALIDPGDNPNSAASGWSQLVIAYGLRNPFRMEIDQATGDCYIGDVGQNGAEEYSRYVFQPGNLQLVNFGWPWREGNLSYSGCGGGMPSGLVGPLRQETSSSWNSIMGGPVYRNAGTPFDFGTSYEGDAFYLDYFAGQVRRLKNNGGSWALAPQVAGQPTSQSWATGFNATTAMRMGPDGGLYYLQHPSTYATNGGFLRRIRSQGPTNSVLAVSGGDQIGAHGDTFPQPIRAQVLDTSGNPIPGGTVNFSVTGGHTLSTTNPVVADSNGFAQTTVTANGAGGALVVTASTPGSQTDGTFDLFARRLSATGIVSSSTLLVLSMINETDAVPAQVPYIVLMSYPGVQTVPTPIGPLCTDPGYSLTLAIEDGIGVFGGVSYSGTGGLGTPNKTWFYQGIPNYLLQGAQMRFQVVGLDPLTGWFRSNCEIEQF
ncbi:MAG: PQQ-dependent sugar dehydrogenase [Planctomycetota bacterium]